MCATGAFREDLWYRIGVFTVRIPPLRDRLEDIPPLALHFARKSGIRLTGVPLAPSAADIGVLLRYAWPGNVRELAAVIERAAILGGGRFLDLAKALGDAPPARAERLAPSAPVAPDRFATLEEVVREHIGRALATTNGRIEGRSGAARLLGINPHTLRGKMRKLGIDWDRYRG
jgi:hydrogenase-4 transcriptional activator